jgi:hypothetical protein
MERKTLIWIGATVGGTVGNYLPLLWGGSSFSFASIILGLIGGIVGIWTGFKLGS